MVRASLIPFLLLLAGVAGAQAPEQDAVRPPQVLERVEAVAPAGANPELTLVLTVTVDREGKVTAVEAQGEVAPDVLAAAKAAVEQWRFVPAERNGQPVASRVLVPFRFLPSSPAPSLAPPPTPATSPEPPPPPAPSPESAPPIEVSVIGRLAPTPRTNSDFRLDRSILASAPRRTGGDVLKSAPGLYLSEPEGRGGPPQIFLRGFDTEHGRDLEILAGGIPLNQPSQVHAHGSVELGGVIPETVREVRVREGVYDPRQGEFAIAGSIEYELGVPERGVHLGATYGEHGTARFVFVHAPEGEAEETFGAFAYSRSNGATRYRRYENAAGIGRYAFGLGSRGRAVVHIASFAGSTALPGVLREDDIHPHLRDEPSSDPSYRLGGTYADPSARGGIVRTSRTELSIALEGMTDDGGRYGLTPYVAHASFLLRENFTGYTLGGDDAFTTGRADFRDERNDDLTVGATAYYRTRRFNLGPTRPRFELGSQVRHDAIDQSHSLLLADGTAAWRNLSQATISQTNVAGYLDADIAIGSLVHLRGGARADLVAQRLDDRIPQPGPDLEQGVRRDGQVVLLSPRASIEVLPTRWLAVSSGYGQGFRSMPAQLLVNGEAPMYARAHSYELGTSVHTPDKAIAFRLIGFRTTMSDDLELDPTTGTLETIGATSRTGFVASLRASAFGWLETSTSVTYTHAVVEEHEHEGEDHDHDEDEHGGHRHLPAPPIVARNDVVASFEVGHIQGAPVRLSLGTAQTLLGRRPMPDGSSLPWVFLLDANAQARWKWLELGVSAENLLDASYIDLAYVFASRWSPTRSTPEPARHFVGGQPRTILGTVTLHL